MSFNDLKSWRDLKADFMADLPEPAKLETLTEGGAESDTQAGQRYLEGTATVRREPSRMK